TRCLRLPAFRLIGSVNHPGNLCRCFQVVDPIAVVEEEVLIGVVVHSLRGSSGPEPVAQEIPLSSVSLQQIIFHMCIQKCQPASEHFIVLIQHPHIPLILIEEPGQCYHDATPGGSSTAMVGGSCLRQDTTTLPPTASFLFASSQRIIHIAPHRLGSPHIPPILPPFGVECPQLVVE